MSTPTFKLPANYASVYWGEPGLTEATTMVGAAIIKSASYENALERIKIEGPKGFVAGFVDMMAGSAGVGGTKFDTEKLTMSLVHGEHATKTWPVLGDVLIISGLTGNAAKLNGEWSVVRENQTYARKTEGDVAYDFERYADVDLT